ncbi:MAG: hypothetical protein RLZZ562_2330 [Planctomycetota bacterium]
MLRTDVPPSALRPVPVPGPAGSATTAPDLAVPQQEQPDFVLLGGVLALAVVAFVMWRRGAKKGGSGGGGAAR